MTSVEEIREGAKYKGITMTCHRRREMVVVLEDDRMVAVNKTLYGHLDVPVRKILSE